MKRPAITPAMRLQVLKLHGALVCCQVCGAATYIADVDIDHELALIDGGSHDFQANMRPVCKACHAIKSAREHKNNAKTKRIVKKRATPSGNGSIKSRPFQGSRKFDGTPVWRTK
jgi:5-methylcytosine-specific restriction endonuclease McrA